MKFAAIADIHGNLPKPNYFPQTDALLISGDLTSGINIDRQHRWYETEFLPWCDNLIKTKTARYVVHCAGNHDLNLWDDYLNNREHRGEIRKNVFYLRECSVELDGIRIYGTPWSNKFMNWGFMGDEGELHKAYSQIPSCDILLSHGPMYGLGDSSAPTNGVSVGSVSLLNKVMDIQPKYVLTGHIHGAEPKSITKMPGIDTQYACTSILDELYRLKYPPVSFEFN